MKTQSSWAKRFHEALNTPCIKDDINRFRNNRTLAKAFPERYQFRLTNLTTMALCIHDGNYPWGKNVQIVTENCFFTYLIQNGNEYSASIME
jgi:hypothetical protein